MGVCEICWRDASMEAVGGDRSVTDVYLELILERGPNAHDYERTKAGKLKPTFPALAMMLRSMADVASTPTKAQWFREAANLCERAKT